jgi:hypothetical protein
LELARSLQRRGDGLGTPPELPGRLEELVRERIASLPRQTLEVLQVAAALSRPTEAVLARAVGGELESLEPALDAGVVELADGRVVFTHPLLASAAYASLSPLRRRKLHRRLPDARGGVRVPNRFPVEVDRAAKVVIERVPRRRRGWPWL